jgi:fructose-1,6-bisphosphatase/inositol monophosphatase family enzyme
MTKHSNQEIHCATRGERSRELQIALETLAAASALALEDQSLIAGAAHTNFKADDSPITAADQEIEQMIVDRLGTFFPNARFLGEEYGGLDPEEGLDGDIWVIDPIDGTTNYALGLSNFACSIGLLRDGKPVLSAVAFPRVNEVYHCDFDGPPWRNKKEIMKVVEDFERHQFLCVPSSIIKWYHFDFSGNIRGFGSTVYHLILVARGVASGAIVRPCLWDIAGALPLLQRAGGDIFSLKTGEPLDIKRWARRGFKPFPMIACSPRNYERLSSVLKMYPAEGFTGDSAESS